jgi:hypothetical protein
MARLAQVTAHVVLLPTRQKQLALARWTSLAAPATRPVQSMMEGFVADMAAARLTNMARQSANVRMEGMAPPVSSTAHATQEGLSVLAMAHALSWMVKWPVHANQAFWEASVNTPAQGSLKVASVLVMDSAT